MYQVFNHIDFRYYIKCVHLCFGLKSNFNIWIQIIMNIVFILIAFAISAYIARLIIPRILLISFRKKLFDMPDERKVHKRAIPRLGGVSFFPTILLSCCAVLVIRTLTGYEISTLLASYILPEFLVLICGMVLLYLTGIADDLVGVRYRQKFIVQIFCAILLVSSGLWINNLYGIFGIYELPPVVGLPFTVFTIVFITNAINLIDGIDGLASGLSGIALLFFTILFIYQREWLYAALAIVTLGTIIPFFYYNVFGNPNRGRKIFMGDTGSLTIGFILSILAIRFSMYDNAVLHRVPDAIVVAFSLLITPVFDVVRVILHRARFGKNIFSPDKNHIHHKFLALGFSHRAAMITILLISAGFAAMNLLLLTRININLLLFLDIFIWTIMQLYLTKKINRKVAGSKA